jgi:oligoendopeptidase F
MKSRDQIQPALKWNLTDIYPDETLWEADYQSAEALVGAFSAHMGGCMRARTRSLPRCATKAALTC